MIKIDFSFFICYYLGVTLLLFLMFWFLDKQKSQPRVLLSADQVWQCTTCMYVYFETKPVKISTCPQCWSFNQRAKQGVGE